MTTKNTAPRSRQPSSADFQSAVSRVCNPQGGRRGQRSGAFQRSADYKSAIQQSATLRYSGLGEFAQAGKTFTHDSTAQRSGDLTECARPRAQQHPPVYRAHSVPPRLGQRASLRPEKSALREFARALEIFPDGSKKHAKVERELDAQDERDAPSSDESIDFPKTLSFRVGSRDSWLNSLPKDHFRLPTLVGLCLLMLLSVGCVSKSKARLQAEKSFLEGQQKALVEQQQQQQPVVWFRGDVRNQRIPWTEGITLSRALLAAQYTWSWDPRTITVTRAGEHYAVDPKRLLRGLEDPELEPGDLVEVRH